MSYHLEINDIVFLIHIIHKSISMWTKMINVKKVNDKELHYSNRCAYVYVYSS